MIINLQLKIIKLKKCVKATNYDTKEVTYYNSLTAGNRYLGINPGSVKMICDKKNGYKTISVSKNNGCKYKFEYIDEGKIPDICFIRKSRDSYKNITDDEFEKLIKISVCHYNKKCK